MKIRYYSDILNDDFAKTDIKADKVDESFKYRNKNPVWNLIAFLLYYAVALPIALIIDKVVFGFKVENRKAFFKVWNKGVFVYSNHTQLLDPFFLPVAAFPKKVYPVAGADAVSITGLKQVVLMLGCIPIPTSLRAFPEFMNTVFHRIDGANCVSIFPEAHIWPYCTKIRPFKATSFKYPVEKNAPVIAAAATYRKREGILGAILKRPAVTFVVSNPIYPDNTLSKYRAAQKLRDQVYGFMSDAASSFEQEEYIRYEPVTDNNSQAFNADG